MIEQLKNGIRYVIESSKDLPVDFYIMLPPCVPATPLETSGAELSCEDLMTFKDEPRVLGLAELMNYPGVITGDFKILKMLAAFSDTIKDGTLRFWQGRTSTPT